MYLHAPSLFGLIWTEMWWQPQWVISEQTTAAQSWWSRLVEFYFFHQDLGGCSTFSFEPSLFSFKSSYTPTQVFHLLCLIIPSLRTVWVSADCCWFTSASCSLCCIYLGEWRPCTKDTHFISVLFCGTIKRKKNHQRSCQKYCLLLYYCYVLNI